MTEMEAFVRSSEDYRRSDGSRPRSPRRQGYDDGRGAREIFSNPMSSSNPWSNIGDKRRADSNHNSGRDHRNSGDHKNFWRERGQKHSGSTTYSLTDKSRKRRESGQYRDRNYHGPQGRVKEEREDLSVFPKHDSPRDSGRRWSYDRFTPSRVRSPPPVQREESTVKEEPGCPPGLLTQHAADPPESREVRKESNSSQHMNVVRDASLGTIDKPMDVDSPPSKPGSSQPNHRASHKDQGVGTHDEPSGLVDNGSTQAESSACPSCRLAPPSGKERDDQPLEVEAKSKAEDEKRIWDQQKAKLEERLKAYDAERVLWEQEKAELKEKLKTHDTEQASWEQERNVMADGIRSLRDIISQQDISLEISKQVFDESAEWEKHCRRAKKVVERQKGEIVNKDLEIKHLHETLSGMGQTLEQTKQLLEARTEENKVAQAFMTTADHYSIADVSRMVDQLNDEIFQCAMDMSDEVLKGQESSLKFTSEDDAWKSRYEEACATVSRLWGVNSVSDLRAGAERSDLILFECLAQNLFVYRCHEVVHRFSVESGEVDRYIGGLWGHILESHEMPIAKNWLAITNSALKQRPFDNPHVFRCLVDLLVATGWRPGASALEDTLRGKLTEITAKAIKIREVISEGVLSAHIEVFCFDKGDTFDSQRMQDAYDVPGKSSSAQCRDGEAIICTTGLGLRCIAARPNSGHTSGGERRQEVVLKAKVVTQLTFSP